MAVSAYVLIRCDGGKAEDVMHDLRKKEHVVRADTVFGDYDVVAVLEISELPSTFSIRTLEKIVLDEIQKVRGVAHTNTHIVTTPD
jgi:DNA-binding Lrp family transcriptional regulator